MTIEEVFQMEIGLYTFIKFKIYDTVGCHIIVTWIGLHPIESKQQQIRTR